MAIPCSRLDREQQVFTECPPDSGQVAKRVEVCNQIQGELTPSGLTTDLKVTKITVTDAAAKIPATPLTDRNSLIIYNKSETKTVFIGKSDVTSSGATEGWEIDPLSYYSLDITDSIEIYAITTATDTAEIKVLELA